MKYHGKLSDAVKLPSQSKWMSGEVKVIMANSSFGMGIDKANVRYVVHVKLPTNIEEYFNNVAEQVVMACHHIVSFFIITVTKTFCTDCLMNKLLHNTKV